MFSWWAALPVVLLSTTRISFAALHMEHSSGAWTYANWDSISSLPEDGGASTAVMVEGKLVVSGSSRTYVYDPTTSTWSPAGANKPIPCNHDEAAAVFGSKIYYFGGYGRQDGATYECCVDSSAQTCTTSSYPPSSQAKVVIWEDLEADVWSTGANVPYPVHAAMTATTIGNYIYVCGGIYMQSVRKPANPSNPANCARFEPITGQWSSAIAPLPLAVDSASSATDGSRLYIFGGRQAGRRTSSFAFDAVQIYNPTDNAWSSTEDAGSHVARMPGPRAETGAAYVPSAGYFFVTGGQSKQVGAHNEVFLYDPLANEWQGASPLPTRFHGHALVADLVRGALYAVGGGATFLGYESKFMFVLDPCTAPSGDSPQLTRCMIHRHCNMDEYCELKQFEGFEGSGAAGCRPCPLIITSNTETPQKCIPHVANFLQDVLGISTPSEVSKAELKRALDTTFPTRASLVPSDDAVACYSTTTTTTTATTTTATFTTTTSTTTTRVCVDGNVDHPDCSLGERGCSLPDIVGEAYRAACPVFCGACAVAE